MTYDINAIAFTVSYHSESKSLEFHISGGHENLLRWGGYLPLAEDSKHFFRLVVGIL